jgi:hypothetical protein
MFVVLKNSPIGRKYIPSYWHFVFRLQQEDNVMPFSLNTNEEEILQGLIEDIPFIIGDTWEDCVTQVEQIIKDNLGDKKQKQCKEFWNKWKTLTDLPTLTRLLRDKVNWTHDSIRHRANSDTLRRCRTFWKNVFENSSLLVELMVRPVVHRF